MFGLTFEKLLVVLVLAAVIVGPHRLPQYAQRLGAFLRTVRTFVEAARTRVETEVGTTLAVEEWRSLDPRQYDPRRIVRDALAAPAAAASAVSAGPDAAASAVSASVAAVPHAARATITDVAEIADAGSATGPGREPQRVAGPTRSGGGGIADLIARGMAARTALAEEPVDDATLDTAGIPAEQPAQSMRVSDSAVSA